MGYKDMKISLNKKLIFYFVSIILLVVVTISFGINVVFEKEFANYIEYSNNNEIEKLVRTIGAEYRNGEWNIKNIEQIGEQSISKGFIVEVYDDEERLIWSALEHDMSSCHQMMGNIESNMMDMFPRWDGEYKTESFRLEDNEGESLGFINIGHYGPFYYLDEDIDFLKSMNNFIIGITIIIIILTLIIALIISRNISRPIRIVSKRAREMSNGGYNQRLDYESNIKELHDLIGSINHLAYNLEEQENLRKQLTTDISHELRTPLTNVQTHLEALIDGIWEPTNERLSSINEEVIRLSSLVSQLKELSSFDSEKSRLNIEKVKLEELIKSIVCNNEGKALEKNISIDLELDEIEAYVDRNKISQLIVNMLSNGIRYTNENGKILIKAYESDKYVKLEFKDTGIGIPEESLKYIFERFYRVDKSRSKKTGGIGVGLTICKSIVDLHGGTIEVKSNVGEGSEFIITLPKQKFNTKR